MTRSLLPLLTAALLLAFHAAGRAAQAPNRPNVLFLSVDDLRPELGCYGNRIVRSPHIDRLAEQGTIFTRAYCQQAVCSPSRSSLMTGRRPDATRVWDLETHFRVALPDTVTLPQHFKQQGYHCAALGKIYHNGYEDGRSWSEPHWYPGGTTVDTDPDDWKRRTVRRVGPGVREYLQPPPPPPAGSNARPRGAAFEVSPKPDDELPDGATAAEAVRRLAQLKAQGKPFFLAVGFLKPHLPFVAPRRYWELYDPATLPVPATHSLPQGAPEFAGHGSGELRSYTNIPKQGPIPADLAQSLRHGYYASLSFMDAQVGRLLDALEREGLAENTVVVLWGDHGWHLGDHGLWNKHTNFELAARAPLIVRDPRLKNSLRRSETLAEFVDVYPTLADLCGLPAPQGVDGVSLRPAMLPGAGLKDRVAISQYPRSGGATGNQPLMGYSLRDERWRLTLWRNRRTGEIAATELYDERNDPAETRNVAALPEHAEVIARLSRRLPQLIPYTPAAPAPRARQDREALFRRKDTNGDGKLSREEFLANQPDPDAAPKRWEMWDQNKDGFLSREEFVFQGKKPPAGSS